MTYFQIMIKTLEFYAKEDLNKDYYDMWGLYQLENIPIWKKQAKLGIIYLLLLEMKNVTNIDDNLLKKIEEQLTTYEISIFKTFQKAYSITEEEIKKDYSYIDTLCLMQTDEIDDNTKDELRKELSNIYSHTFQKNISENIQYEVLDTPLNTIIHMVVTTIAELFFTPKGCKYLPSEYEIKDITLRSQCYEYITDRFIDYKYGANDNCFLDEYDSLYYAIKLTYIITELLKNKKYDMLKKLMSIDDYLTWDIQNTDEHNYKTAIEILYETRNISQLNLHDNAFIPSKNDIYLNFFLNNKTLNSLFSDKEIALILLYFFDPQDLDPIDEIINNIENIKRIIKSSYSLTQKGKQLKKLKKSILQTKERKILTKKRQEKRDF